MVAAAAAVAPAELQTNLNRLVARTALQEYTATRKRQTFEAAMAAMAADPRSRAPPLIYWRLPDRGGRPSA